MPAWPVTLGDSVHWGQGLHGAHQLRSIVASVLRNGLDQAQATSQDTNGLIRQYAPKGRNLARLTSDDCTRIARHLNQRPRKRLGFRTPEECSYER